MAQPSRHKAALLVIVLIAAVALVPGATRNATTTVQNDASLADVCVTALDAWQAAGIADALADEGAAPGATSLAAALAKEAARLEYLLEQCANASSAGTTDGAGFTTSADVSDGDGEGEQVPVETTVPPLVGSTGYTKSTELCIRNTYWHNINFKVSPLDDQQAKAWDGSANPGNEYGGDGVEIKAGEWDCRHLEFREGGDATVAAQVVQSASEADPSVTPGPGQELFGLQIRFFIQDRSEWDLDHRPYRLEVTPSGNPAYPNSYLTGGIAASPPIEGDNYNNGYMVYLNSNGAQDQSLPGMVFHYKYSWS